MHISSVKYSGTVQYEETMVTVPYHTICQMELGAIIGSLRLFTCLKLLLKRFFKD